MLEVSSEEFVVLLDSSGKSIGTMPKAVVHTADTPLHSAFSVFLFSRDGCMLAQRRAWSKLTWPGVWSNACCGHPAEGELHVDAALRRMRHELGIEGVTVEMVLPGFRYRAEQGGIVENEICPVMVGVLDRALQTQLHPDEVAEVRWVPWKEFLQADPEDINCEYGSFSPWSLLEARALDESSRFAEIMEAMEVRLK